MIWVIVYLYVAGGFYTFAVEYENTMSFALGLVAAIFWPLIVPVVYSWRVLNLIRF